MTSSLIRPRQPEPPLEIAGLFWRMTLPGSRVGTRLYRQLVALAGELVLRTVVMGLQSETVERDADRAAEMWGADTALRVLRAAHAGEPIAEADVIDLQLALAGLVAPAGLEKISAIGEELLWESELMVSRSKQAFTGPDTFGADRSSRDAWERSLDAIIPDVATRSKLEVWAFLLLCRPFSSAGRTTR